MPGLFSLSNELLIQIFAACPTVQTAIQLSRVNKQLRSIWVQHTDVIVKGIIEATIPAADIAIEFAMLETCLRNSLGDDGQPPLSLWLPNLMINAELCAHAHTACAAFVDPPNSVRKTPMTFPSSPAHWYWIRKFLLAFDYPQLRDALYADLLATPEETREELFRFHWYLVSFSSRDVAIGQGMPLEFRFPPAYVDETDMHQNAWSYMCDILCTARGDLTNDSDELSLAIQGIVS